MQGVSASITSSASTTAKGSPPTSSTARSTAWPRPSASFWRDVGNVDHVGDAAHDGQQILFLAAFEEVLEFEADVEVILDGGFAAPGDDDDVLNPGVDRFFDAVLNDGLVDDRQHLFGLGLGGGQKAGSQPGGGENGFANFSGHPLQFRLPPRDLATGYNSGVRCRST